MFLFASFFPSLSLSFSFSLFLSMFLFLLLPPLVACAFLSAPFRGASLTVLTNTRKIFQEAKNTFVMETRRCVCRNREDGPRESVGSGARAREGGGRGEGRGEVGRYYVCGWFHVRSRKTEKYLQARRTTTVHGVTGRRIPCRNDFVD